MAAGSCGAPRPAGSRTASPISHTAWSTPNASATPCASARCATGGRHCDRPQADWPLLGIRSTAGLSRQAPLPAAALARPPSSLQPSAAQWLARGAQASPPTGPAADVQRVAGDSLRLARPRSVGVEQLGLGALDPVGLPDWWAQPASERETQRWLRPRSGLGEWLGVACETVGALQLHRASEALGNHREALETHLCDRALGLFDRQPTVLILP